MNAISTFLDGVYAGCFNSDPAGRTIYFPNGAMGGGYVVPDAATHDAIRRKLRWFFVTVVAVAGAGSPLAVRLMQGLDTLTAVAAFAGLLVAFTLIGVLFSRTTSAGLEKADVKLTLTEAVAAQSRALPRWFSTFSLVLWSLGLVGGVLILSNAANTRETIYGIFVVLASAAFLALSVWSRRSRPLS